MRDVGVCKCVCVCVCACACVYVPCHTNIGWIVLFQKCQQLVHSASSVNDVLERGEGGMGEGGRERKRWGREGRERGKEGEGWGREGRDRGREREGGGG